MKKSLLLLGAFFICALSVGAQTVGPTGAHQSNGVPVGGCVGTDVSIDFTTSILYNCIGGVWTPLPAPIVVGSLVSQFTTTSSTPSNVPGLKFLVQPNQNYGASCYIVYQVSSSSTVAQLSFTGPASPTAVLYGVQYQTALNASPTYFQGAASTSFGSAAGVSGGTTATNLTAIVHFGLINGANAGTVQLQAAAVVTGTFTIQAGSWCKIQ